MTSDPFSTLQLRPSLLLTDQDIQDAFTATGQTAEAVAARHTLLSPALRLQAWMTLSGLPLERHAPIPEAIIPLFSEMAAVVSQVKELAHEKQATRSLLAQTLAEKKLFLEKGKLDALAHKIQEHEKTLLKHFTTLPSDPSGANNILQALKFLEKWKAELNATYTLLFL